MSDYPRVSEEITQTVKQKGIQLRSLPNGAIQFEKGVQEYASQPTLWASDLDDMILALLALQAARLKRTGK